MPQKIILPQFPLSLVVFPGEKLNLHIFEPRYRQLVQDADKQGINFGIPPYWKSKLIYFGTEVKLLEVSKIYEDGKMDIKTEGTRVYQIHTFKKNVADKLYAGAEISFVNQDYSFDHELSKVIIDKMDALFKLMSVEKSVSVYENDFNSFKIAHHVGLDMNQKIRLLSMANESQRLHFIDGHLDDLIPAIRKAEDMKKRIAQNGHFKNIVPPNF